MNSQNKINPEEMLKIYNSLNSGHSREEIMKQAQKNLTSEEKDSIKSILNDKEKIRQILKSPEAIKILKILSNQK